VFVREAHKRGIARHHRAGDQPHVRQHPWFQAARRAPKGSHKRDFYVWSDDPKRYAETRIIFTDTEKSNWAWDDIASSTTGTGSSTISPT